MFFLSEELLYEINGGDQSDYDFGYYVGQTLKSIANAITNTVSNAWDAITGASAN